MCDYPLRVIRNRLAGKDEFLVVYRFDTGSKGLTSPDWLSIKLPKAQGKWSALINKIIGIRQEICAVCVPDGARLEIHGLSTEHQLAYGLNSSEEVTFRQVFSDPYIYRDAVEFKNGVKLTLQDLDEGQCLKVVALSSDKADMIEQSLIRIRLFSK